MLKKYKSQSPWLLYFKSRKIGNPFANVSEDTCVTVTLYRFMIGYADYFHKTSFNLLKNVDVVVS